MNEEYWHKVVESPFELRIMSCPEYLLAYFFHLLKGNLFLGVSFFFFFFN